MAKSATPEPGGRPPLAAALFAMVIGLAGALAGAPAAHPAELAPAADWRPEPFSPCIREECRFEGRSGGDVYRIAGGHLERLDDGSRVYRHNLTERFEKVLMAGISPAANQLVVAIVRQRVSVAGRSALRRGPGIHPKDIEREHRLAVVNPKSGEVVKSIDLGPYLPRDLAVSGHGAHVLLTGEDLHLHSRELRIYNTRSGKLEVQRELPGHQAVTLGTEGVILGDRPFRLAVSEETGKRRFNSRDPYSIAEYVVECAAGRLIPDELAGRTFAVVAFEGADAEVNRMLTSALALELRGAGLEVAEREQIDTILDELWLQTTGATEAETASRLGKLANVQFLVFGSLNEAGTTSSLAVRSVNVEEGEVAAGCEVTCRDCRRDDYLEALKHLSSVWMGDGG